MRRSSAYYPLTCVVECKPAGQAFYEVIAAFNVDSVAVDCAKDYFNSHMNSYRSSGPFHYRVKERREGSNVFVKTLYCSEPERSK